METNPKNQQLMTYLSQVFRDQVPFHQLIGIEFDQVDPEQCKISFKSKPQLIGNFVQSMLHGGVIATALDVVGGTLAAAAMLNKHQDEPYEVIAKKMTRVSTIDLRVDFVRPGKGESFYAMARLLRSGNKVAVVRMELHDQKDTLIALGTGTYMTA